ncbi:hypothetical protein N0V93_009817 [Gnomoniopsis smithogilvyi]|uniref:CobW C-terminal domain-containing protein n=1 Tax=Gnomoniopsis smithogilvyi TaxID=1191159 RepID=A0A9W9CSP7_9PEZI|nr:hypothetical protein N0V93_009817 [Gnomoniopsis smithogilvyi]
MAKRRLVKNDPASKLAKNKKHKKVGPLPVTLISGFLGSGKTTLLQHILKSDHGYRIAVIVNDIGEINVDASLIRSTHRITKTKENVIALQNGCICCTLRGDLLSELIELSERHVFDYVIIESSGISEPAQVAESFDAGLSEQMLKVARDEGSLDAKLERSLEKLSKAGEAGLTKFARLDTTVTVIDAFTFFSDFETSDFLSNRRNDVVPEDERTVSHLMIDQIEFAEVIILNKTDMFRNNKAILSEIKGLIQTLNRRAKIVCTSHGRVDVAEVVGTGSFDLEEARTGAGWLQDLHDMMIREVNNKNVITPKPETEEYNVRNFVYRRHRPFHPERLQRLICDKFILQLEHQDEEENDTEPDVKYIDDEEPKNVSVCKKGTDDQSLKLPEHDGWEDEDDMDMDEASTPPSTASIKSDADTNMTSPISAKHQSSKGGGALDLDESPEDDLIAPSNEVILENKRQHPLLGRLFRSKGIFWLATRSGYSGMWSQAGAMLTLLSDRRWFCTYTPEELAAWCPDGELRKQIQDDIDRGGEWGDRRQEIVFIGEKLDVKGIEALLDQCLVNDEEWETLQPLERVIKEEEEIRRKSAERVEEAKEGISRLFKDGFPDWPAHYPDEEPEEDEGEDEDHDGHHH